MSKKTAFLYALISAMILGCAYPPVGFGFLAYVSLVPMLFIVNSVKIRQVFLWSLVSGLFFHAFTISWIRHITWVGMVLSVVALAFFYSLPFILARSTIEISSDKGIFIFIPLL